MPKPLKKKLKAIPKFKSEAAEREFWRRNDTVDYVDWEHARRVALPRLRPSTETISLRLPVPLLADLKSLANERDVPYQSLLKVFLAERVAQEWAAQRRNTRDEALRTAGPPRGRELI